MKSLERRVAPAARADAGTTYAEPEAPSRRAEVPHAEKPAAEKPKLSEEIAIEEINIDGMCGVY
ncbi:mycofactocin precursor [Rubrobacter marinus]|uniref:Mycofactocin n=1 Tax=Rubrobacter marinus TaxID=2653852 RepID=A0A6G8Q204_9ACTN|nr:mycofactocin precursor MftA [Rubrobacter marinus]QIN80493.1 mycofactocin precursor [Rubrobacter marinus]